MVITISNFILENIFSSSLIVCKNLYLTFSDIPITSDYKGYKTVKKKKPLWLFKGFSWH